MGANGMDRDGTSRVQSAVEAAAPLSLDTVFELLANRRRRFALYALTDASSDVLEIEALVEDVATLCAALDSAAVTRDGYLQTALDLVDWHLPVLSEVGVVECDPRHRTIRYRPHRGLEFWVDRARADELA